MKILYVLWVLIFLAGLQLQAGFFNNFYKPSTKKGITGFNGNGGRGIWNKRDNIAGNGDEGPASPIFAMILAFGKNSQRKPERNVIIEDITIKSKELAARDLNVTDAASRLVGEVFDKEKVDEFVALINYWFHIKGYVFSGVKSYTQYNNGTLVIQTNEARLAKEPLVIQFMKKVPIKANATNSADQEEEVDPENPKYTLTPVPGNKGKTSSKMLRKFLKLEGGEVFRWHPERWSAIEKSGIFEVADVQPKILNDEEVQMVVTCCEAQTMSFSPGLTKSISDSRWGADLVFEDRNFLGTAKVVGLDIKRNAWDPFASGFLRISDSGFNLGPSYLTSVFRECANGRIQENRHRRDNQQKASILRRVIGNYTSSNALAINPFIRNGISFQMRRPSESQTITLGGTVEMLQPYQFNDKTSSKVVFSMNHEQIKVWNRQWGQSTGRLSLMGGVQCQSAKNSLSVNAKDLFYKGYGSVSHVIPLDTHLVPSRLAGTEAPTLALLHSAVQETPSVPTHYAAQLGGPFSIRGFFTGELGVPSTALSGSTELRVPIKLTEASEFTAVAFVDYGAFKALQNGQMTRDIAFSHGVGFKMGMFRFDYAVTDTGDARAHFGLANPLF